ncbi:MAG: fluoride efflux transporter CrcB [Bacteroidota bacterium]|nr:fluoride efflux transporter CrcB [Bacteroidota bacterium]
MKQVFLVFFGGGLGSVLRFGFTKFLQTVPNQFPLGTFCVNIIGCLLIGFLMGLGLKTDNLSQSQTILLVTGFCGGFTTFSAFTAENQFFLKSGDYLLFGVYTMASILTGILAVFVGLFIAKQL